MSLLYSINENEFFTITELYDTRNNFLRESELKLRLILKKISFEEELQFIDS